AGTEGFSGGNALAYQWYAVAPNTSAWTVLANGGVFSGATSPTLVISDVSALDGYQFYSQVRENTATCYAASNAVMIEVGTATWNGSGTPAAPTVASKVILESDYDTSVHGSFEACSVTINSGQTLTIDSSDYVLIQYDLNVNGTLHISNSGSLVMVDDSGTVN